MRPAPQVYSKVLFRAIDVCGGLDPLAAHLGFSPGTILRWLEGTQDMPLDAFLSAVDLVLSSKPAPHGGAVGLERGTKPRS